MYQLGNYIVWRHDTCTQDKSYSFINGDTMHVQRTNTNGTQCNLMRIQCTYKGQHVLCSPPPPPRLLYMHGISIQCRFSFPIDWSSVYADVGSHTFVHARTRVQFNGDTQYIYGDTMYVQKTYLCLKRDNAFSKDQSYGSCMACSYMYLLSCTK